jgi:hypothetical protein
MKTSLRVGRQSFCAGTLRPVRSCSGRSKLSLAQCQLAKESRRVGVEADAAHQFLTELMKPLIMILALACLVGCKTKLPAPAQNVVVQFTEKHGAYAALQFVELPEPEARAVIARGIAIEAHPDK